MKRHMVRFRLPWREERWERGVHEGDELGGGDGGMRIKGKKEE
jgi:hypothetical protein